MTTMSNFRHHRGAASVDVTRLRAAVLLGAFVSFVLSVFLFFVVGDEMQGIFVGLWVPSILGLGAVLLAGESR